MLHVLFLDAEKEKLELEQANAVTKALSIQECPVKEKHVGPPHLHQQLLTKSRKCQRPSRIKFSVEEKLWGIVMVIFIMNSF